MLVSSTNALCVGLYVFLLKTASDFEIADDHLYRPLSDGNSISNMISMTMRDEDGCG
jgi:hypothetical protein